MRRCSGISRGSSLHVRQKPIYQHSCQACTDPDLLGQSVPVESARHVGSAVEDTTVQLFHIVRRIHHVAFGIISVCFPSGLGYTQVVLDFDV